MPIEFNTSAVHILNGDDYDGIPAFCGDTPRIAALEDTMDKITNETEVAATLTLVANEYVNSSGAFVSYNGWSRTDYIPVAPGSTIKIVATEKSQYNCSYNASKQLVGSKWTVFKGENIKTVGSSVHYIVLSGTSAKMAQIEVYTGDSTVVLDEDLALTETMAEEVDAKIADATRLDTMLYPSAALTKLQIPDYYFSRNETPTDKDDLGYIEAKIKSIPDGYHFIFWTDTHWVDNAEQSPKLISYVRDRIGAKIVLFGGDILTAHSTAAIAYRSLWDFIATSKNEFGSNFLPVVGNHDLNSSGANDAHLMYTDLVPVFKQGCDARFHYCDFYDERIDALAVSENIPDADVAKLKQYFRTCYYVDDLEGKTRFIVYNTGIGSLDGGSGIQTYISSDISGSYEELLIIEWMYSVLMSTPSGFNIVACSHIPCSASTAGNIGTPITAVRKAFATLFPAFLSKGNKTIYISDSISGIENWCDREKAYDFSNAPDIKTLCIMGGHYHVDTFVRFGYSSGGADQAHTSGVQTAARETAMTVLQSSGTITTGHYRREVPIIFTQHDAYTRNSVTNSYTMTLDTTTEQCFDVVTIKPNGDIALTRFGAGVDRYVTVQ